MIEPQLLTVPEAAARLRISKTKAYALVHSGDIPSVRVGVQIRIPLSGIINMMMVRRDERLAEHLARAFPLFLDRMTKAYPEKFTEDERERARRVFAEVLREELGHPPTNTP